MNGFDDKRGDVAFVEFCLQRGEIVKRNGPAIGQKRLEATPKTLISIERQRAIRQAMKGFLAVDNGRLAGGAAGVFHGGFYAFCPGIGEKHPIQLIGHPLLEFFGQQAAEEWGFHLDEAGIIRL